jgi:sugar phosphate isomerase/epimerase
MRGRTMGRLMTNSLKRCYPFRLATTSFIHPAGYGTNVRRLSPLVDEIELLFLERDHLPSNAEIGDLRDLAEQIDITYNIHLPMDISLADPVPTIRRRSMDAVLKALELSAPLNATSYTLHLTYQEADHHPKSVQTWQDTAVGILTRLLKNTPVAPRSLCLETLDFPPAWLAPIVERLDLSVCIDVGHVILFGYGLQETLNLFSQRIGIFHLHGVSGTQDHRSLDHLHPDIRKMLAGVFKEFYGSISLEVFSYPELSDSMICFRDMMARVSDFKPGQTVRT